MTPGTRNFSRTQPNLFSSYMKANLRVKEKPAIRETKCRAVPGLAFYNRNRGVRFPGGETTPLCWYRGVWFPGGGIRPITWNTFLLCTLSIVPRRLAGRALPPMQETTQSGEASSVAGSPKCVPPREMLGDHEGDHSDASLPTLTRLLFLLHRLAPSVNPSLFVDGLVGSSVDPFSAASFPGPRWLLAGSSGFLFLTSRLSP